ncbi:MAG: hypothetical protein PVJ62_00275 [Deltaproteobacteria bacterium]|jgi:hypothetical protein
MRRLIRLAVVFAVGSGLAIVGCAGLSSPRIQLEDLPQTPYEVTRYRSSTKSTAIILDNPDDDVLVTFSKDEFRTKKEGLNPPERYLKLFMGTPQVYRLEDKESKQVLGYLLISVDLDWLVHYDRGAGQVNIAVEDPHSGGGNGGE